MKTSKRLVPGLVAVFGMLFSGVGTVLLEHYLKTRTSESPRPSILPREAPKTAEETAPSRAMTNVAPIPPSLEIQSDPAGAEVYLNWRLRGKTPVSLQNPPSRSRLVITKEGYRPVIRDVEDGAVRIEASLSRESPRPASPLLVLISAQEPARVCEGLRSYLAQAGLEVLGEREAKNLQQAVRAAGSLQNPGLRAWARAAFGTDYVLEASCRASTRDLSNQLATSAPLQNAAQGVVTAEVTVDLSLFDLRRGTPAPSLSKTTRDFAFDPQQAIQKALRGAVQEASPLLREYLSR
jgi:hypothetical protein